MAFFPTYQPQKVHFFGIQNEAREGSNDTSTALSTEEEHRYKKEQRIEVKEHP